MAYILSVVQRKGGAGKTTLAVNLGGALADAGLPVALVDSDPQGSASHWAAMGQLRFPVYQLPLETDQLRAWGEAVAAIRTDVLIVDTPAFLDSAVYSAVMIADVLLMPCGPSGLDLEATRQTLKLIDTVRAHRLRPGPKIILVPTRVNARTLEGQMILKELESLGHPVSPPLGQRTAFLRAYATGESVSTFAPGSPADHEIRRLLEFMRSATRVDRRQPIGPEPRRSAS